MTDQQTRTNPGAYSGDEGITGRARGFARDQARSLADDTDLSRRAADHVGRYAGALSNMGNELEEDGAERFAHYVQDVADRLFEIGERIHDQDFRGAAREVRSFAEENPEIFLGLSFAAGAFLGRVVREFMAGSTESTGGRQDFGLRPHESGTSDLISSPSALRGEYLG